MLFHSLNAITDALGKRTPFQQFLSHFYKWGTIGKLRTSAIQSAYSGTVSLDILGLVWLWTWVQKGHLKVTKVKKSLSWLQIILTNVIRYISVKFYLSITIGYAFMPFFVILLNPLNALPIISYNSDIFGPIFKNEVCMESLEPRLYYY